MVFVLAVISALLALALSNAVEMLALFSSMLSLTDSALALIVALIFAMSVTLVLIFTKLAEMFC